MFTRSGKRQDQQIKNVNGIILFIQNSFLFAITIIPAIFYAIIVLIFYRSIKNVNRENMENNSKITSYIVECFKLKETA